MISSDYVVVGAGIFGSVIAERIASVLKQSVTVLEKRFHIGGNCYSEVDQSTGIECHRYGSHIFHTSDSKVWEYISRFSKFTNYRHRVKVASEGQTYFLPINLKMIRDVYGKSLTPSEAKDLLAKECGSYPEPANFEEKAISLIGETLYRKFIRGYTVKQWGKDPKELPAALVGRLPVRFNYDTDYFNTEWQGIPLEGYGRLFEKLLDNPRITVLLDTSFQDVRAQISPSSKIIYTGTIDGYFDYSLGELEWRSLDFEWETLPVHDFQGTAVMNYADEQVKYTRVHEFKHYHPERTAVFESGRTVICREYPGEWAKGKDAYYPVNTARNQRLLCQYERLAAQIPNLVFGGRLGSYCYCDMDATIANALRCFETEILNA